MRQAARAGLTAAAAAVALGMSVLTTGARALDLKRDIEYAAPGGQALLLDAYLPEGEGPHPAVVVIHGGSWRSGSKSQLAVHALAIARAGVAAFAINYRLAPAHPFPAQIEDCVAAVRFVRARAKEYGIDPGRVGAYGYSAGGHLAALLGASDDGAWDPDGRVPDGAPSARVQAVVAGGAPCDFRNVRAGSRVFVYWLGKTPGEDPDLYRRVSPAAHAGPGDPPMLFFHGDADALVGIDEPRGMIEVLTAAGVETELLVLPGAGHIAAAAHPRAISRTAEYLAAKLAAGVPAPAPAKPKGRHFSER